MDCDTEGSKQEKCDEISNEMNSMSIKDFLGENTHNPQKFWSEFDRVSWNDRESSRADV